MQAQADYHSWALQAANNNALAKQTSACSYFFALWLLFELVSVSVHPNVFGIVLYAYQFISILANAESENLFSGRVYHTNFNKTEKIT